MLSHDCSAVHDDTVGISIRLWDDLCAITVDARAIIDMVVSVVNPIELPHPIPDFLCRLKILIITRSSRQTGGELKVAPVANTVLVCQPVGVVGPDLPEDATTAVLGIPTTLQLVKDVLGHV